MEPVCNAMMQWINEHGYTPTGVAYEFYYNSPDQVPERLVLTKIVFPLK
ncbi:MAG: GyrI-like domain-containing protein [Bacillota bacterium]